MYSTRGIGLNPPTFMYHQPYAKEKKRKHYYLLVALYDSGNHLKIFGHPF